jgi:hypothetical protein
MKNIKQTEVDRRNLIRAAHPQPGPGLGPPHDVVLLVQTRIAGSAATASSSSSDMSPPKAASSVQSRSSMVSFMASILVARQRHCSKDITYPQAARAEMAASVAST